MDQEQVHHSEDANPASDELEFQIGIELWNKAESSTDEAEKLSLRASATDRFVAAARLNPQNSAAFRHLGHLYAAADPPRAAKCYQRAVAVDPADADSGEALCDLFDLQGKESLEVAVCGEAARRSPRAFWAFRRLGYLQVHQKRWTEAVQNLQQAIRGYPTCAHLWEGLGLAYHRLGRFTAAIKSYGRAIELDSRMVFALIESGNVYLMLTLFKKGIEQFRQALHISPESISAKYGLALGLLGLAKDCMFMGAFQWGATLLEEACEVAKETTLLAGNSSCVWKLLGDIQLSYAKCYPWVEENLNVESEEAFSASIKTWKKTRCLAANSAKHSYQRALLLAPWESNNYMDIAISSDLINSLTDSSSSKTDAWQLSEKMALGALLLKPENYEFWAALGYLSNHNALKQHALIRALQLDTSLAVAWAYLGKLYRREGEKQLAKQAFDFSRSIDPSLALPWAGMAADYFSGENAKDEAFESCLRAVQILPLAEFQIGLAKLAAVSGHLSSPEVLAAIRQAVHHIPHYPEVHNLKGLINEARLDYHSASSSYGLAQYAVINSSPSVSNSLLKDVSINLARSLCKAGNVVEAVRECENLKAKGWLDVETLQIYAFSLWKLGRSNSALSIAIDLASSVSTMDRSCVSSSVSLISQLLYSISGLDSVTNRILKMPKELFQSSGVSFIVSAINSLDRSSRIASVVSVSRNCLKSQEDISSMHYLIALGKLVKSGSESSIGLKSGVAHLRKAIHMYPNSGLLRNLLGYLLLYGEEWNNTHLATRCPAKLASFSAINGLKTAQEILGAASVACYAVCTANPKFTYPTCSHQCLNEPGVIHKLQKCLRREPWNQTVRYLLILNLYQKAREERFPPHQCLVLQRLISVALSDKCYNPSDISHQYQKFQLLLCSSAISLQSGNQNDCVKKANEASSIITLPNGYLFFAHLLLCRAFALKCDTASLQREYNTCVELKTDCHIGLICLRIIESQYGIGDSVSIKELNLKENWMSLFNLVEGLISVWKQDLLSAEEFFRQACALSGAESCLQLCLGATCMELATQWGDSQYLSLAIKSLMKAKEASIIPLPIVSTLLAQAHGGLGSKEKWETNLRAEWFTWSPEWRPAELFFQMHLLARQTKSRPKSGNVEHCQSLQSWVLRAIHTNPCCARYWKVLQKLNE